MDIQNNLHWIVIAIIVIFVVIRLLGRKSRRVGYSDNQQQNDYAQHDHTDYQPNEDENLWDDIDDTDEEYMTPNDAPAGHWQQSSHRRSGKWDPKSGKPAPIIAIIFVLFWLLAWTAGILFVLSAVISGELFLLLWLVPALIGEFIVIRMLFKMIKSRSGGRNQR